jgi:hypothetical protein
LEEQIQTNNNNKVAANDA